MAARRTATAAPAPEAEAPATDQKGSAWLAALVTEQTGQEFDAYSIRILLRKLAKDGTIERGEGRYNFSGPKDKTVLAVVKAVKSGVADAAKKERLDELKAKREAKKEAPAEEAADKPAPRRRTRKAAAPKAEAPADEDLDIDEI